MNIKIRLLLESEISSANDVYNEAYGNIRSLDSFKWEFINGPWGKAIYVIAEDLDRDGNKIVGTQCAIPMMFINGKGEKVLTAKSEDTFVHPDYRGHKLFDKMYELLFSECKKAGIQYLWGFTYARKPFLKLGFQIPFDTLQGLLILKPVKSFKYLSSLNESNGFKEKIKILVLVFGARLNSVMHSISLSSKRIISAGKDYSLKKKLLQANLRSNSDLWSIEQSESYLEWRLKLNPFSNDYVQFTNDNNIDSINSAVLVNYRKEGFAYIEELNFSNAASIKSCLSLIKEMIRYSKTHSKVFLFRFWGFEGNQTTRTELSLLKKVGFVFVRKGTAFVWKDLKENNNSIKPENILLSRLFTQGNR